MNNDNNNEHSVYNEHNKLKGVITSIDLERDQSVVSETSVCFDENTIFKDGDSSNLDIGKYIEAKVEKRNKEYHSN